MIKKYFYIYFCFLSFLISCDISKNDNNLENNLNNLEGYNIMQINVINEDDTNTKIKITFGDKVVKGYLNNTITAKEFIRKLPLRMQMTRYGDREYYGKVGEDLSVNQNSITNIFKRGDISYWIPGKSFALFINDEANPYLSNLVVIGKITTDLNVFSDMENLENAYIELDL